MDNRRIHSVERDDRGIDRGKLNSKLYSTFDYKKLLFEKDYLKSKFKSNYILRKHSQPFVNIIEVYCSKYLGNGNYKKMDTCPFKFNIKVCYYVTFHGQIHRYKYILCLAPKHQKYKGCQTFILNYKLRFVIV